MNDASATPREKRPPRRRHEAGNTLLVLAAVLALLVTGGGMNYVRNLQADQASEETRPFHGYDKDDLVALKSAYEAELAQLEDRYEAQRSHRRTTGRKAMMDESLADFERVREHTAQVRELGSEVAEREARIRELDRELAARAEIGEGWDAHLRRLTRF